MRRLTPILLTTAFVVAGLAGCTSPSTTTEMVATEGKIPITTSSEEARQEFLQGRDLAERLLAQKSIQHFDKAISLDPNFALAELGRANVAPTPKEFFDHLRRAVALSDGVSEGERHLILSAEAAANGDPVQRKEHLDALVALFPGDERVQFAMGNYWFGRQEYPDAIHHYRKSIELEPNYSTAYNILGYAYRQMGNYDEAERAFKRYTELIPDDPNPYDSYAELLLKMGRFEESIVQYRRALSIDPNFVASHVGIAADFMYMGKPEEARAELRKIMDSARNDGERRTALTGEIVLAVDGGKIEEGLRLLDERFSLAEKANDSAAMAADFQLRGNLLFELGKYDEAKEAFDRAVETVESSALSPEIKDNARLTHHHNLAVVALGKKDYATAKAEAEQFLGGATVTDNTGLLRQAHSLLGRIALSEKNYETAIAELEQANQQNSYNLYRLSVAYQGKGDTEKAEEYCEKAANFNPLPSVNHALIRKKAEDMLENLKS